MRFALEKSKERKAFFLNFQPRISRSEFAMSLRAHAMKRKQCTAAGCGNAAQKQGLCYKHGAARTRCSQCDKKAERGGLCYAHGAERTECGEEGCANRAQRGGLCYSHGAGRTMCVEKGCPNRAQKAGLCFSHGAERRMCKYHSESMCGICVKTDKYDGACARCFVHYNPSDERASSANRYARVKEQTVRDCIQSHFPTLPFHCDRRIRSSFHDNFALVRPDMRPLLHCVGIHSHDLVIEVDEWRHESEGYGGCKGEDERVAAMWRNLSEARKPIVVLRINPDDYVDPSTDCVVKTCFAYSKARGRVGVRPCKQSEWGWRMEKLRQRVAYWTVEGNVPDREMTVEQLFY